MKYIYEIEIFMGNLNIYKCEVLKETLKTLTIKTRNFKRVLRKTELNCVWNKTLFADDLEEGKGIFIEYLSSENKKAKFEISKRENFIKELEG